MNIVLISTLLISIIYCFKYYRKLYLIDYIIIFGYHLIFTFQGLYYSLNHFSESKLPIRVIGNYLDYDSSYKASILILLFLIFFLAIYPKSKNFNYKLKKRKIDSTLTCVIIFLISFLFSIFLISKIGGIVYGIQNPGQNIGGQTILILMLGIGKFPLLRDLINNRVRIFPLLIFLYVFVITMFNSRFLAISMLLEVLICYDFFIKKIDLKKLIFPSIIILFIIFGYGLYRDFSYRFDAKSFEDFLFYINEVNYSIALEWFFAYNIEGFTGLANIIREFNTNPSLNFDYGLSQFSSFLNLIPNAIRTSDEFFISDINNYVISLFPVNSSVVPSSLELFFGGYGYFGIPIYAILFSFLLKTFKKSIFTSRRKELVIVLLVYCVSGFRGSILGILVYFGTISFFIYSLYNFISNLLWVRK